VLGRTLGGATTAMLQGVIVLVICLIAGFRIHHPWLVPLALVFMFLIALVFAAIGTAIGSVLRDMQGFQLIMNFLVMPLFFLSGALYPLHGLPTWLSVLTRLDPLTYVVGPMRYAVLSHLPLDPAAVHALSPSITWAGWPVPIMLSLGIVLVMGLAMMGVAIATFSKTE